MCKEIFNEIEFIKREYEFLRMITFIEELSEEVVEKISNIQNQVLKDEKTQKYVIRQFF